MSALQKYLEKSGMNLSYMKNAIRASRAAGTPILRNEAQVMEHLNKTEPSLVKKIPFIGESLHNKYLQKTTDMLTAKGPVYVPKVTALGNSGNFVYMPKGSPLEAGQSYSPRAALLHELGHATHFNEDPITVKGIASRIYDSPAVNAANTNLRETIANNNAILGMREGGVPEHLIDTYKDRVQSPFYNDYAESLTGSLNSPTGNMKLPERMMHGVVKRLKRFGQNITDSGGLAGTYYPSLPAPTPILPKQSTSLAARSKASPKDLIARIKGMASSQPSSFAPMKEIPTYTHPVAQEFNVPYSVK